MNLWHIKPFARLSFWVSRKSRERKLAQFFESCKPGPEDTVLDIGVAPGAGWSTYFGCSGVENFLEASYRWPERVTGLSIDPLVEFTEQYPGMQAVQADACKLPFRDKSFDIVFSNAVVEHVGDYKRQEALISECLRVARKYVFITAPNRLFPYDVHIGIPLLHLLPRELWSRFTSDAYLHLLFPWEFRQRFPSSCSPQQLSPLWSPSIAMLADMQPEAVTRLARQ